MPNLGWTPSFALRANDGVQLERCLGAKHEERVTGMRNNTWRILIPGLAIALGACGGGSDSSNSTVDEIRIGIGVAQTSNVALLGQEQVAGAKIAEQYFNDAGGVNGTPIKLVLQDTAGDEAGAINAFQTLINKDKVLTAIRKFAKCLQCRTQF